MSGLFALLKWIVGLGALLWLAIAAWMALFQSRLVYQPMRSVTGSPRDVGLAYEELQLRSRDASGAPVWIQAWFVPAPQVGEAKPAPLPAMGKSAPSGPPPGRGTVLFCHGNAGNLGHRLETLQILHRLGMNVLIFDYQGYGESQGRPSETGTLADAGTALQWVLERGERPERIVVMGRSLGGAVAAALAAQCSSPLAGLVLESTFTSIPDMGALLYPWLPVRLLSRYQYDTLKLLPALAQKNQPLLVIHSPEDDIVPAELGRTLYEEYDGPKQFMEISGNHNQGFLLTGPAYDQSLDRFFRDVLEKRGSKLSES